MLKIGLIKRNQLIASKIVNNNKSISEFSSELFFFNKKVTFILKLHLFRHVKKKRKNIINLTGQLLIISLALINMWV